MNFVSMLTQNILPLALQACLAKAKDLKPTDVADDPVCSAEWDKLFKSLEENAEGICHICDKGISQALSPRLNKANVSNVSGAAAVVDDF